MTTYTHDGVEFDLGSAYRDVFGSEWSWTGGWSRAGEPLMLADTRRPGCRVPVPLPDVYRDFGPLFRIAPRPSSAERRAAVDVDPDYAASVAAGFVESPAQFASRLPAKSPASVVAGATFTTPLESRGLRAFLKTLNRGA